MKKVNIVKILLMILLTISSTSAQNGALLLSSFNLKDVIKSNTIRVSPNNITALCGGGTYLINVTGENNKPFNVSAEISHNWIHIVPDGSTLKIICDPNNGIERTGYVFAYAFNCVGTARITIKQDGKQKKPEGIFTKKDHSIR